MYEDDADDHERLVRLRFELQRRLDATPDTDDSARRFLRQAIVEVEALIARLRSKHHE